VPTNGAIGAGLCQFITGRRFLRISTCLRRDEPFLFHVADGVYEAALADRNFYPLPMTGFPLWDANANPDGCAAENLHVAPRGTLLLSGTPVTDDENGFRFCGRARSLNTLPVFYWWDTTNQIWQAASGHEQKLSVHRPRLEISATRPTARSGACSGFAAYAYRSTDDGHSYTAFDINARVADKLFPDSLLGWSDDVWKNFQRSPPAVTTKSSSAAKAVAICTRRTTVRRGRALIPTSRSGFRESAGPQH